MPAEILESIFVKRERLVSDAVKQVRASALSPTKSHLLFVGPRGIGKTHLLSLIYHRVKAMDDVREHLAVAWLHEDEGGIASFLDLLLAILTALCEDDPALKPRLSAIRERLYDSKNAEQEAKSFLREIVAERTLLLMAENLDDLFTGLGDMGQKKLRSFLQETRIVTTVVTAQSLFGGISRHASPFYGFFQVEHLTELTSDEARGLLVKIAKQEENGDLVSFLETPAGLARIRAVNYLVSGNPRLYVIFSELLTRQSLDELVPPFLDLLDNLTPYYQSKMRLLSPQQRKIAEYLTSNGGATAVKEIARRTFIAAPTVAAQLKELRQKGYVRSYKIGRESLYEIKEPLMRLCLDVKKQRGEPIKLLVELLRLWYPREELEKQLDALPADVPFSRDYLREALRQQAQDVFLSSENFREMSKGRATKNRLDSSASVNVSRNLMSKGIDFIESDQYEQALDMFEQALMSDGINGSLWWWKGATLQDLARYEEALEAFDQALKVEPEDAWSWRLKGVALRDLARYEEALEALDQALKIEPEDAWSWLWKGVALSDMGRNEDVPATFARALAFSQDDKDARDIFLNFITRLNRWEERIAILDATLPTFRGRQEEVVPSTVTLIQKLLIGEHSRWSEHIAAMTSVYRNHDCSAVLGQAIVQTIPALADSFLNAEGRQHWYEIWRAEAGNIPEFKLPLRLLDAAIRYLGSGNPPDARILLELPVEERNLLKPLLNVEKGVLDEPEEEE